MAHLPSPPPAGAAISLHIPHANPAWGLILQSGGSIACTVGISLAALLRTELGLGEDQLRPVDAFLLDGMPVDEPETTVVPDGARIALAAGLPGIAGLALKSGSAVRALRAGITHRENELPHPRPGTILLSLYSLVLPLLAGHFLQRGVTVDAAQILRYARFAPDDPCRFRDETLFARDLARALADIPATTRLFLTAGALCRQ